MALRGTLRDTYPEDLLQILALGGRTGILTVSDGRHASRLLFREGEIVDAFDEARRGEEAIFALLTSRTGSFAFTAEPVTSDRTIHRSVSAILITAARRMDDLARAQGLLGKPTARPYRVADTQAEASAELDEAQWRMLGSVDGRRTVGEIIAAGGMGTDRAYGVLASLVERGLVGLATAADEGNPWVSDGEGEPAAGPGGLGSAAADPRRATPDDLREVAAHVRAAAGPPAERGGYG